MRKIASTFTGLVLCGGMTVGPSLAWPQSSQQENSANSATAAPQAVPVMDGGAGSCTLDLIVTSAGKPVPAANVKVHISYGLVGVRKLDLDAYTNNDGKLKFTGLPARVRRPPLEFRATKDQMAGTAVYDPQSECQAKHEIVLVRQPSGQN